MLIDALMLVSIFARLTVIKYQASFPISFGTEDFTFRQRLDQSCSLCCILRFGVEIRRL